MPDGAVMSGLLTRLLPHLGVGALLGLAMLGLALKVQTGRLGDARRALATEQALRQRDRAEVKAAQAKAQADWQAELARIAEHNRRLSNDADRKTDHSRAVYSARVLRLPAAPTDPAAAGTAPLPRAHPAARPDGSGGDSLLLARSDALICADNTARLQAAHDWARGIEAANRGGATPAPAPRSAKVPDAGDEQFIVNSQSTN
mgnify:CR=1 FL=1